MPTHPSTPRTSRRIAAVLATTALTGILAAVPAHATVVNPPGNYTVPNGTGSLGPANPGDTITQAQVTARAKEWIDSQVPYSEGAGWVDSATGGPYRSDCSGFVSMAWGLKDSLVTQTLPSVSTVVASDITGATNLQTGDALDYTAKHVVLFDHWTDSNGDFAYDAEHMGGVLPSQSTGSIYNSTLEGYALQDFEGLRYNNITATPKTHDATGDGKSDLMIYEPDGTIQMGVGNGDGFSNYHEISSGWGGFDGRIHFADVTGDGKADILIYEPDGTIQMGVGTGNGFTNYHQISSGWGGYDGRIQFADINGDGKADMLIFQPDGTLTVGISNGNGFTNYHEISSGWSTYYPRIQFADVTGDGKADILIYEPDGTIQMGVGTGDGFTN
ncbi:FG-GAP repeat domain-containing protein, partial [Streptacidiphilus jiangxiensis]